MSKKFQQRRRVNKDIRKFFSPSNTDCFGEKSVDTALTHFLNDLVAALDQKLFLTGVFIDMMNAFDYVDNRLLLSCYSMRGLIS